MVYAVHTDSIPMIVLSDKFVMKQLLRLQVYHLDTRRTKFDIVNSIQNMTKYAVMISTSFNSSRSSRHDIARSGRRGPTWIDVPLNIQSMIVEEDELYPIEEIDIYHVYKDDAELFSILKNAKRPCLLPGNGVVNSGNKDNSNLLK